MINSLRDAIKARNTSAVTEAMVAMRHASAQSNALLEALNECTVAELKHVQSWAEDWLSDPRHNAPICTSDPSWQAMTSVYALTRAVLRTAGVTRSADGATA